MGLIRFTVIPVNFISDIQCFEAVARTEAWRLQRHPAVVDRLRPGHETGALADE
jgi:hypothetical protein